jgi:hypothetical protein
MSPDLELPTWLPPILVEEVTRIRAMPLPPDASASRKAIETLRRLTSDYRMKGVWQELYKKKRELNHPTNKYLHAVSYSRASRVRAHGSKDDDKDDHVEEHKRKFIHSQTAYFMHRAPQYQAGPQWSEQDRGIGDFFYHAYCYACDVPFKIRSRSEVRKDLAELCQLGDRLQNEAETLASFGMEAEALELKRIASECYDLSSAYETSTDPWLIDRHRGDRRLRDYVVWLSIITRKLFGAPLYGILAITSNVAFNRDDVTGPYIREMLRAHPASEIYA